jgi:predicted nucleic-acid-binding protein
MIGWVLNRSYKRTRSDFLQALKNVLNSETLRFASESPLKQALLLFAWTNAGFGDCLIATCSTFNNGKTVVTFDRKAAAALGMRILPDL